MFCRQGVGSIGKSVENRDPNATLFRPPLRTALTGFGILAVFCLTFWAYGPALEAGWYLDDGRNIVDSPALHWTEFSIANLKSVVDSSLLWKRPVANLSFALDHLAWGLEPRAYHLTNVLIHLAVGLVLLCLCAVYMRVTEGTREGVSQRRSRVILALLPVALFLLHPLNTQAVTYVVQRMASMAAFFSLLAFLCYLVARYRIRSRPTAWYAAAGSAWLLALGSKENAIMLLPVVVAYEACFFRDAWRARAERVVSRNWSGRLTLVLWLVVTIFVASAAALVMMSSDNVGLVGQFPNRDFSGWERVLTQARVQLFHLFQLAWPAPESLNLEHDFAISRDFLTPATTLPAIVACAVLLASSAYLAVGHPRYGFPLVAYALFHSLEAGPLSLEIIFEHRMYLPSSMLALAGAVLLADLRPRRRSGALVLLAASGLLLANWTHARNELWADPVAFNADMAAKSPHNIRVQYNYALALTRAGRGDDALPVIRHAIELDAASARLRVLLGETLVGLGRATEGIGAYQEAVRLAPTDTRSLVGLGKALLAAGDSDAAYRHYLENGIRLARGGKPWQAISLLDEGVSLRPADGGIRNALGGAYLTAGLRDKALEQFRTATELDPSQFEAWFNLGLVAEALGYEEEAVAAYRRFLEVAPAHLQQPIARARSRIRALVGDPAR